MRSDRWKILIVVEATAAGVGRHVRDLCAGLNLDRFDVTVAWSPLRSDEQFRRAITELQQRGVHTVAIPMTRGLNPVRDLAGLFQLRRLIARGRFDLVHSHSSKAGFLGRLATRLARPSAKNVYSPNAISIPLNRAYWVPEKVAGWMTDAMVAVSESEHAELTGYRLVPASRLRLVTAGISLPDDVSATQSKLREELGIPRDALLIGTVGRVSYQKDPQTFLEVADKILRSNSIARFVWIGPGPDLDAMRAEVQRRGLADRILFIGYRSDAQTLLQALDIFVLTSRYESFGYVTCEAMSFARPVVATRVAGSSELVDDGVTGFLAPPGDAEAFAAGIQRLLDDEKLRNSFGKAGRARVEQHFSLGRMVAQTEQLYASLLSTGRPQAEAGVFGRSVEVE